MRIAIDYTTAMQEGAGTGAYTRKLVAALLRQDTDHQYLLLTHGRVSKARPFPRASNVRARTLPLSNRLPNTPRSPWRFPLPTRFFTGPLDIYHSPDYILPPLGKRTRKIMTIHDLAFLEHPEYVEPTLAAYLHRVLPATIANADVIIATSEEIRHALIRHMQAPREKIVRLAPGVAPYFRRISDPLLLNATRHKYGLRHPFVLTVGRQEVRENQEGLIKAFQQSAKKKAGPAQLVIVGEPGWRAEEIRRVAAELKIDKKVRFLEQVSDLELITLYSMADMCVFPALYAGSGTRVLEAMACGAPVITSNIATLAETVGDASLQVEPHNIEAIAQAISRLLGNPDLCEELRQRGYARTRQYAWENVAQQILSLYQEMYNGQTDFADKGVRVL